MRIIVAVLFALALWVFLALLFAFPVKWLWNWLMPEIFNLKEIGVFQAWGLMMLSAIIFRQNVSATTVEK